MSREYYKNRPIFDVTGKELTEQEKEAAYNLTSNILDSVEAEDESKKSIDQYLLLNNNYKSANEECVFSYCNSNKRKNHICF